MRASSVLVVGAVPRFVEVELVVQIVLFEVGEEQYPPAVQRRPALSVTTAGGSRPPLVRAQILNAKPICRRLLEDQLGNGRCGLGPIRKGPTVQSASTIRMIAGPLPALGQMPHVVRQLAVRRHENTSRTTV